MPKKTTKTAPKKPRIKLDIWNRKQIAEAFGVSVGRINQLVTDEIIKSTDRNQYPILENVKSYIKSLKDVEPSVTEELANEKLLLTAAKREKEELQLKELQGILVKKSEVEKEAFDLGRLIRDNILNIIPRLTPQLAAEVNEQKIIMILETELKQALENLSE